MFEQVRVNRRLPIGAEVHPGYGVHFRVWAPRCRMVDVVIGEGDDRRVHELAAESDGYFSGFVADALDGTLYRYRLDEGDAFPDPASRFQPQGPHGPSQVVDPSHFHWTDRAWAGASRDGQVIYEMHVGTFTPEGTWSAAAARLEHLRDLGITVVEVMPIAEFTGAFGWGYDGVDLYAPFHLYGPPDELRRFVDRAHALGIAVILDVVYNHFGPDGNYAGRFAEHYFSKRYENEWGDPLNFDGDGSVPVREYFVANAGYWIDEYHFDGLRLDATQQIFDASDVNVMREVRRRVREAAGTRATLVVAENEPQDVRLLRAAEAGGHEIDALWNDDFQHAARVALTGKNDAYYSDYLGTAQEFVSATKHGFLYQGQRYHWQKKRRGSPALEFPPQAFIHFLENHDQVANSASGLRLASLASPGGLRALTALLLLAPQTPMLFQGQEFASSAPFHFFADHPPVLAAGVRKGRAEFMSQFRGLATAAMREHLPDPESRDAFEVCRLDWEEVARNSHVLAMHRDLLRLRREDGVMGNGHGCIGLDGAVLASHAFVLRFFADDGHDRLLLVNLGRDLRYAPAPEPLLAPPAACSWADLWSSEDPRYGGPGIAPVETDEGWRIPGQAAVVLIAEAEK